MFKPGVGLIWPALAGVAVVTLSSAQVSAMEGYGGYEAISTEMRALAEQYPDACRVLPMGESRRGRELAALELGRGDAQPDRQAMAIVAGIEGDFPAGPAVALRVARSLLSASEGEPGRELLDKHVVYVLPILNPDALEASLAGPRKALRWAVRPTDDDRDGKFDEDGPEDLNGDGLITQMRVAVSGPLAHRLVATHLCDAEEPRLLRKADPAKGETAVYAVLTEGVDSDGDLAYNEDGLGGVDINRNFLHEYKEHDLGTGPHQLSEPESKALVDFFFSHPRIAIALFYGRHDNIAEAPKGSPGSGAERAAAGQSMRGGRRGGGPMGFRRPRRPTEPKGLHADDVTIYQQISEVYQKITGIKKAVSEPSDGAVYAWAYAQYGIPSFACRVWNRPEPEEKKGDEVGEGEGDAAERSEEERRGGRGGPPPGMRGGRRGMMMRPGGPDAKKDDAGGDKEAAAWLKYSDEKREGAGFVPWTPFDHPQLGTVEIGGFVPMFRTTPPASLLPEIAEKQTAFVLDLGTRFPVISLTTPIVNRLSETLFEIKTALRNDGYFPAGIGMAKMNRRAKPIIVTLDVPIDRIIGGNRVEREWSLPGSGGRHELRWVIRGEPGSRVTIRVTSEKFGDSRMDLELTPTTGEEEGS